MSCILLSVRVSDLHCLSRPNQDFLCQEYDSEHA